MKMNRRVLMAAAVCGALAITNDATAAPRPKDAELTPLAMPEGITIQPLGIAQGYSLSKETATKLPREKIVYANAVGMTLYSSDNDVPGKSMCIDACAKNWLPALVPQGAKLAPNWTVLARADGTKQWAHNGKPLYTFVGDTDVGSVGGKSPARFGRGPLIGPRGTASKSIAKDKALPEGWHAEVMYPAAAVDLPPGVSVWEVEDAMAMVFVEDKSRRTLYTFDGDANKAEHACASNACRSTWTPFVAPRLASGKGDFTISTRDDGITQWQYKGHALFTHANDLQFDEANGINVDKRWQVATYGRYFLPSNVSVQDTPKLGKVLATTEGHTLYRRSSYIYQSGGGHGIRRGDTLRPAVGRDLNINPHCESDCDKWHPYLAPKGAIASGDWTLYDRPDGTQQWASRGYALWTYDGDKKPADLNGNDAYDIMFSHDPNQALDIGTPYDGAWALFWIAAYP